VHLLGDGPGAHVGVEDLPHAPHAVAGLLLRLGLDACLGPFPVEQTRRRLDEEAVVTVHERGKAKLAREDDGAMRRVV
jgi:hypothetical protein